MKNKDFTFDSNDNTILTKYTGTSKTVVIPEYVTEIGGGAFALNEKIIKVVFNSKCKKIRESAFSDCKNLEEVVFPSDCKMSIIEKDAFARTNIEKFEFPNNVKTINDCFCGVDMKELKLSNTARTIKEEAVDIFIDYLFVPESVETIEYLAIPPKTMILTKLPFSKPRWDVSSCCAVYNVENQTIFEHEDFLYVRCLDENGLYLTIVGLTNNKKLYKIPKYINLIPVRGLCLERIEKGTAIYIPKTIELFDFAYDIKDKVVLLFETNNIKDVLCNAYEEKMVSFNPADYVKLCPNMVNQIGINDDSFYSNDEFDYYVKNNEAYIYHFKNISCHTIVPEQIDGHKVVYIASRAILENVVQEKLLWLELPEDIRTSNVITESFKDFHCITFGKKIVASYKSLYFWHPDDVVGYYYFKYFDTDFLWDNGKKLFPIEAGEANGFKYIIFQSSKGEKETLLVKSLFDGTPKLPEQINGAKVTAYCDGAFEIPYDGYFATSRKTNSALFKAAKETLKVVNLIRYFGNYGNYGSIV